jgi:hypothetical protein
MSAHGRIIVNPNAAVSPRPSDLHRSLAGACSSRDVESCAAAARAGDAEGETVSPLVPMVMMVGATRDGIEVTAARVSKPQANWPSMELHCPYGNVSIMSSVCHASGDPLGMLDSALDKLPSQVGRFAPESEEQTAFVTYSSMSTQARLATGGLRAALTRYGSEEGRDSNDWDNWDADILILSTGEDCTSLGLKKSSIDGNKIH